MKQLVIVVGIVAIAAVLIACAAPQAAEPTKALEEEDTPAGSTPAPSTGDVLAMQQEAIADLAARLGIDEGQVQVLSQRTTELTSQDFACEGATPSAGDKTLPAEMMGQEIVLAVGKRQYLYRGYGKRVVFCGEAGDTGPRPSSSPSAGESGKEALDEDGLHMLAQAREELAQKLGANPKDITVVAAEPIMWSDTSLGCPEPGKMYAQVITPGYQFILAYEGKQYDYHAGRGHLVLCEPGK